MRKRYERIESILLIFFLTTITFFLGCGSGNNNVLKKDDIPQYIENTYIYSLQGLGDRYSLIDFDKEYIYFTVLEEKKDDEGINEITSFYRQSVTQKGSPEKLGLTLSDSIVKDTIVHDGNIIILTVNEEDGMLSYSIIEYDCGTKIKQTECQSDIKDWPRKIIYINDTVLGIMYDKRLDIVERDSGTVSYYVECPGTEFISASNEDNGTIALSYKKENSGTFLLTCNADGRIVSQDNPIDGAGDFILKDNDEVMYFTVSGFYKYLPDNEKAVQVLDIQGRNIQASQIVSASYSEGNIEVLGYTADYRGAKLITYSQDNENKIGNSDSDQDHDQYGREYIYIYDVAGSFPKDSTNPIDAYNEQSDKYQVILKDYSWGTDIDSYNAAKSVVSGDYPDMIYSEYTSQIDRLLNDGLFVDLTGYIQDSKTLNMQDLSVEIINAYTKNGILFALPDFYSMEALYGAEEALNQGFWNVDEFLLWLSEHPESGGMVTTRRQIFDACSDALLEYIDFESATCDFCSEEFANIISKFAVLGRKDSYSKEESMAMYENEKERIYSFLYSPGTIATMENDNKLNYVIKGYPSTQDTPYIYIKAPAMSILNTSDNKEGAYDFLEFYLRYSGEIMGDSGEKLGVTRFFTLNEFKERGIEGLLKATAVDGKPCSFSKDQIDKVLEISHIAKLRDYSKDQIKEVIWDELLQYLDGGRDLYDTCEIIDQRVKIMIMEQQ